MTGSPISFSVVSMILMVLKYLVRILSSFSTSSLREVWAFRSLSQPLMISS